MSWRVIYNQFNFALGVTMPRSSRDKNLWCCGCLGLYLLCLMEWRNIVSIRPRAIAPYTHNESLIFSPCTLPPCCLCVSIFKVKRYDFLCGILRHTTSYRHSYNPITFLAILLLLLLVQLDLHLSRKFG